MIDIAPLCSCNLYTPSCEFTSVVGDNSGNPIWRRYIYSGTTWTESTKSLLYTSSTISSVDDLEPLLTAGRLFHFKDGTRSTAELTAIGKCPNDTPDDDYTFNGFGLCYEFRTSGILRYSSSYIITYNYEPQGGYTPGYTIASMKFWGTSIASLSSTKSDSVKVTYNDTYTTATWVPYILDTSTDSSSNTYGNIGYSNAFEFKPSTSTLIIGTGNGDRTEIGPGAVEVFDYVNSTTTKKIKITPNSIRMEPNASEGLTISQDSSTNTKLNFRYATQGGAQPVTLDVGTGSVTAATITATTALNGTATAAKAYDDSFTGTNSIYSALSFKLQITVSATSTTYDFNTLTTTGIYLVVVAKSTSTNKPYSDLGGRCAILILNSDGYVTQTVFDNHVYYRECKNNNPGTSSSDWNAWQTL